MLSLVLFLFPGLRPVCSLKPLDAFLRFPLSSRDFPESVSHVCKLSISQRTQTKHPLLPCQVFSILLSKMLLGNHTHTHAHLHSQFHITCLVLLSWDYLSAEFLQHALPLTDLCIFFCIMHASCVLSHLPHFMIAYGNHSRFLLILMPLGNVLVYLQY